MSGSPNWIDGVGADELALVTEAFGLAIVKAQSAAAHSIIRDPRVSPDGLVAGLCKANALSLASTIVSAGRQLGIEGADLAILQEQLLAAAVSTVRGTIEEARADRFSRAMRS